MKTEDDVSRSQTNTGTYRLAQIVFLLGICFFVVCLKIFYDKRFLIKTTFSFETDKSFQSCFWFIVVLHISKYPCFLWNHTKECFLFCTILCSAVQVPPLRAYFKRKLGNWSFILIPYMPVRQIAPSLRQIFGPPFVLYTIASSFAHFQDDTAAFWSVVISMFSTSCAIYSGVFLRPDNDWARNSWLVGSVNTKKRKRVHGSLMITSTVLNTLLWIFHNIS